MRLMTTALTTILAAATLMTSVPIARAQSCQQLWVERNGYYARAGYCFKTSRGINYFGNSSCQVDNERDLRLSRDTRERIAEIQRLERRLGCGN